MERSSLEGAGQKMKTDDEILKEAKERYKEGRNAASAWREEARRCFNFRAGNQWAEEDRAALIEQRRMPTTFNRIDPYVRAIAGLEAGNRQEIRYVPREMGDVAVNELYTETARWIRDQSAAEYEEAESFLDAVISGVGCTETYMDYDDDPEGMVKIDRLDCLTEVVWDGAARKRNLTDRKYDFRIKRDIDREEIEAMFPDKADLIGPSKDWDDVGEDKEPWDRNPETAYKKGTDVDVGKKCKYTLVDYQWCEKEVYVQIADPLSGKIIEMDVEKYESLSQNLGQRGVDLPAAKMRRTVWYRAFIVGGAVMEAGPGPCKYSSTRKFITGYRDTTRKIWYGIVRAMIDPQEWANKFFSQILHIINSNSKGGLMAETDAFVNPRKAEEQWSDASSVLLLKPGGLAKVTQRSPAQIPASIDRMMQFSIQALGDVTGLPLELIGMVDRDQAGVLEAERKKTGITMLATLFDSFKQYHQDQGTLLLHYIQEYMSDGRLVRINGQNGQQYVPLMKQPDTIKFDVIVDEMPESPNNKERVWASLQVLLPQLMQAGMPPQMLEEFIRYSPLPESFAEKMKQLMAQQAQQGPNPAQKAQLAKNEADVHATRAKAGLDEAKTAETLFNTGLQAAQANMMAEQMMMGGGQWQNQQPPQQPQPMPFGGPMQPPPMAVQ